jgi:TRAP-type uncharacterized transport system fused permease subunit
MGMIVGSVNVTGLGLKVTDLMILASGGNAVVLILFIAIASLVLGMALPTTAAYIVVAALAVPALVDIGIHPLSAHLAILWLSQDSNITPPVAVAAYVAASIAKASAWKTGWTSFIFGKILYVGTLLLVFTPVMMLDSVSKGLIYIILRVIPGIICVTVSFSGWWVRPINLSLRFLLAIISYFMFFGQNYQAAIAIILGIITTLWAWYKKERPA